jgi:hypothetical protein
MSKQGRMRRRGDDWDDFDRRSNRPPSFHILTTVKDGTRHVGEEAAFPKLPDKIFAERIFSSAGANERECL